jgi:hypothetical protein
MRNIIDIRRKVGFIHACVKRGKNQILRQTLGCLRSNGGQCSDRDQGDLQRQTHALSHPAGHANAGKCPRPLTKRHRTQRPTLDAALG